jgi:1-acyl-sn-glycerol-3-phosphate acyltransferase
MMASSPVDRSWVKFLFYRVIRTSARVLFVFVFDLRCLGREHTYVPGGGLIVSTHQSHLDPVLVGITFAEHLHYVARRTLFDSKLLAVIIRLLDAIELDRDRTGLAGLKETLKRLKSGHKVLIFPEGTRCCDGRIAPLKPGFIAVARRAKVPLIPVAVTGAFEVLPRHAKLPRRYPLRVCVGPAISADLVPTLDDEQLLELVSQRLHACYDRAQRHRQGSG